MEGNQGHDFTNLFIDIFNWVGKYSVAIVAGVVAAILKTGKDWMDKRPLTRMQRAGLFMVTISFAIIGWWVCRLAGMTIESVAVPLIIVMFAYLGEDILRWVYKNRNQIISWMLFRNWKNDKGSDK